MRVDIKIGRHRELSHCALPAVGQELLRRLVHNFNNCSLVIRRASAVGLTVLGGVEGDKKQLEKILQNTRLSADDWCC